MTADRETEPEAMASPDADLADGQRTREWHQASNRHAAWHPSRDLQQISLHVDDLVLAVPFAEKEVLQEKLVHVRKLKARMFQREFPEGDRMHRDVFLAERGLHDLLMEIDTLIS